ncbi:MAG: transcription elongation factor GreA [Candidatus Paceibacterota bacterium]
MDEDKKYLSQEKFNEIEAELSHLKKTERKNIAERLEYAKSLGDLSENAEYHEARDQQAEVESRIQELETLIKQAVIVTKHRHTKVDIGSTVIIAKTGGDEIKYQIVGSEEADMATNKISYQSPLGAALFGHKKDETVIVTTPGGEVVYKIIEVK